MNIVAMDCLVQSKTKTGYDRIFDAVKGMIPIAAPGRILLEFQNASMGAFRSLLPTATAMGRYFHLTQSVVGKVQEIGLEADREKDDNLRIACNSLLIGLGHGSCSRNCRGFPDNNAKPRKNS
jgi:hypothetical protein